MTYSSLFEISHHYVMKHLEIVHMSRKQLNMELKRNVEEIEGFPYPTMICVNMED